MAEPVTLGLLHKFMFSCLFLGPDVAIRLGQGTSRFLLFHKRFSIFKELVKPSIQVLDPFLKATIMKYEARLFHPQP